MKVLVAYDGTLQSKDALIYGVEKVRKNGGELIALHVFNSSVFIDYDASPRAEEIARQESYRHVEDAKRIIEDFGKNVQTRIIVEEGNPEEELLRYARARNVDVLLCPPRFKSMIKKFKKTFNEQGKEIVENTVFDGTVSIKRAAVSAQ